jgi:hypothetical protein
LKAGHAQVTVDGCTGGVSTFIVEPFVPHEHEFYLCIRSERLGDTISFRSPDESMLPTSKALVVGPDRCFDNELDLQ